MSELQQHTPIALIGAGPIGLETAIQMNRSGLEYLHFEKGQVAATIMAYPPGTIYFSSPERIAIAGIPIPNVSQTKTTKEQYIAYLRSVAEAFDLQIRNYEPVENIRQTDTGGFLLQTTTACGTRTHTYTSDKVILAIGDMAFPRRLEIPGEQLSHVSHTLAEPHTYFRKKVLIVGGKNSAAEAALRCFRAGADVALSYRGDQLNDRSIKYWIYPELQGLIKRGKIESYFNSKPVAITPDTIQLQTTGHEAETFSVEADFVLLLTGFQPDQKLFRQLGVKLEGPERAPLYNADTMETNVPGVYVAGTALAGEQKKYRLFIENCHIHAQRITHALLGKEPPPADNPWDLPEN